MFGQTRTCVRHWRASRRLAIFLLVLTLVLIIFVTFTSFGRKQSQQQSTDTDAAAVSPNAIIVSLFILGSMVICIPFGLGAYRRTRSAMVKSTNDQYSTHGVRILMALAAFSVLLIFVITAFVRPSPAAAADALPCRQPVSVIATYRGEPGSSAELIPRRSSSHSAPLNAAYAVPNDVHYVWCGRDSRQFEFRHYLGLLSVIHFMQPDNVFFYYDVAPSVDEHHYNTWLSELEDVYPFFRKIASPVCLSGQRKMAFVDEQLCVTGGIFVAENVVITRPLHDYRKTGSATVSAYDSGNAMLKFAAEGGCLQNETKKPVNLQCMRGSDYNRRKFELDLPECVLIDRKIRPKDLWESADPLARLLRTVAYGKPSPVRPEPDRMQLIPNIGHVVWLGGGEMKFDFFLCVLSLLHVAEVDAVYIHGEAPSGPYWALLADNPKVKVIRRTLGNIYGSTYAAEHDHKQTISDLCRVDILLRYGGIYVDIDVIAVQPLGRRLRSYEAVVGLDVNTAVGTEFPDTISNGVMAAKPNSRFFRLFMDSMKSYVVTDYFSIAIRRGYQIKERFPDTVRIDSRLQVLCPDGKCRPHWGPNYTLDNVNQLTSPYLMHHWKNATFALHFTSRTPDELVSPAALLTTDSMISDVGRYVLERAGMLNYFRKRVGASGGLLSTKSKA